MSIFAEIIGGGLGKLVKEVIGSFKLDPAKKAEIEALVDQHEHEVRMKEMELQIKSMDAESKAIEIAGQNIRAETGSGDKFTSRARPSFIYIMIIILGWNYIAVPLFHHDPISLPEAIFWLFGSVMLGYTGARTWEKIGLPGNKK